MKIKIINLTKLNVLEYSNDIYKILSQDLLNYWKEEHLLMDLPFKWENSYVLLIDDSLIGCIICSIKNNCIHVHKLYIDENYKGRGFGKRILFHCLEKAVQVDKCSLFVYENNMGAVLFYDKRSFQVIEKSIDEFGLKYKLEGSINKILES